MNVAAQWIVRRVARASTGLARGRVSSHGLTRQPARRPPAAPPSAVNRLMEVLAWLAAATRVAILGVVVWSVAQARRGALEPRPADEDAGAVQPQPTTQGLANAFVGSLVIVGLATLMALPVGILVAIYLNEYARAVDPHAVSLRSTC